MYCILLLPFSAVGQQKIHLHEHPVLNSINEARNAGTLTIDESILQKFYIAHRPDNLRPEFRELVDSGHIKCLVPIYKDYIEIKDQLSASTIREIETMFAISDSETKYSYTSPSGVFIFHYDTSGSNGVSAERTLPGAIEAEIPDYIYKAAFAADSSYRYQVEQLGFSDFAESSPLDVFVENIQYYGEFRYMGNRTSIHIHNNYNGFPPNTHPEGDQTGALYVTLAHEIKHAIQYEANRLRSPIAWEEMDATMMEEVVFNDVNDYYNYIFNPSRAHEPNFFSIFGNPQNPTPVAYAHITWMLYFEEVYGIDFWVDTWDEIEEEVNNGRLIPFLDAIERSLAARGERFASGHLKNHLWHLGSGEEFADADFGFRERQFYPNPSITDELIFVPDSISNTGLRPLAANYIRADAPMMSIGQPGIRIEATVPGIGIGLIGVFNDGTARKLSAVNENSATGQIQTPWNWSDLAELRIAVVNTNRSRTADYTLTLESILPEEDILAQNYPNPFNPTTRIEFSLNSRKDVRIDVYDAVGRRVSTLLNQTLGEGFHFVDFDGSNLASGAYFYRIITDQTVTTNKMMLIK